MNREIKVKKVKGKGRIYYNPCPERESAHTTVMIGTVSCQNCPRFVKIITKDNKQFVHCKNK